MESQVPKLEFHLYYLQALLQQKSDVTSLSLGFIVYKVEEIIASESSNMGLRKLSEIMNVKVHGTGPHTHNTW